LENRWLQSENNPKELGLILAPDFLHVLPVGIITRDQQLDFMRNHPAHAPATQKHFADIHVRIYGTAGVVNGVVVAADARTTRRTLFTDVFVYRDGKWQAVNAQELPENESQ
jgi:hypothetical protein